MTDYVIESITYSDFDPGQVNERFFERVVSDVYRKNEEKRLAATIWLSINIL